MKRSQRTLFKKSPDTRGRHMTNVIRLAIKTEKDAIAFYKEAAEKTRHPFGKRMFLSIKEDEERHLEDFMCIMQDLDIGDRDPMSPMKKMKTIIEEHKDVLLERIMATTDEIDALRIAMQMEKDSIKYYKGVSMGIHTAREKALFGRLVREEQEHYDILSNTYSFLTDTGNWFMWEEHSIIDGGTPWA
jgi:rubrerythrin